MGSAAKLTGALEAVLFAHGEPMSVERLAVLCGASVPEVESALTEIGASLESDESRGLALLRHGASAQLVTHPRFADQIAELLRGELSQDLGPASMETLALVAYFGPISRAKVDHVRGVSSAVSLRTLLVRGMIERTREGKGEHMYQVTPEFMREMGITDRESLPDFGELSALLERSLNARDTSEEEKAP